jgi:hypothetical protein
MSKTNGTSKLGRATQVRELRNDELEKVSGGKMHLEDISLAFSIDIGTSENLVVNASGKSF